MENTMNKNNLTDVQKGHLKQFFQEALISKLDRDEARHEKALDILKSQGISESDFDALFPEPADIFAILGDDAISEDLQARLRDSDASNSNFGWGVKPFKGFYPMFDKE